MGKKVDKPYNGGQWSAARFKSFITSALRGASQRWGPKHAALKAARVGQGKYRCAACEAVIPKTLPPKNGTTKRRNNTIVDHVKPVVPLDGKWGDTTEYLGVNWNEYIQNMFCEVDGLQVLEASCNKQKTDEENIKRKAYRKLGKIQP